MPRKSKSVADLSGEVFPRRLRDILQKRHKTQSQLAKEIGVSNQVISLYTTGQSRPSFETLVKIAGALRVSCDYLLGASINPSPGSVNPSPGSVREINAPPCLAGDVVLSLLDFDLMASAVSDESASKDALLYTLNRVILGLCSDDIEFLRDMAAFCQRSHEIIAAVGVDETGHYPGTGGALMYSEEITANYTKCQRYNLALSFDRFLDHISDFEFSKDAARSFYATHSPAWVSEDGKRSGPILYDSEDQPQNITEEEYKELIAARLSAQLSGALERLNYGICEKENE